MEIRAYKSLSAAVITSLLGLSLNGCQATSSIRPLNNSHWLLTDQRCANPQVPANSIVELNKQVPSNFCHRVERTSTPATQVTVKVFPLWTGEGPVPPEGELARPSVVLPRFMMDNAELNMIWLAQLGTNPADVQADEEVRVLTAESPIKALERPVFVREVVVDHTAKQPNKLALRVYDRDKLDPDRTEEITQFVSKIASASATKNRIQAEQIPILSEVVRLVLALPDAFLSDDTICEFSLPIYFNEKIIELQTGWFVRKHCVIQVDADGLGATPQ